MPSMPPVEKRKPGDPDRRNGDPGTPSTSIMQGYEKMGHKGRRRLMWVGLAMLIAGAGVGLFATALSFYRFFVVILVVLIGTGFVFPQYGIKAMEMVVPLLKRPDRRNQE